MADNGEEAEKELEEEDDTPKYFKPLMTKDKKQRDAFLDNFTNSLKFWHRRSVSENDVVAKQLLRRHSITVLRLAVTCPFSDVRTKLTETLKLLNEEMGVKIPEVHVPGPSSFIPPDQIFCYNSPMDTLRGDIQDIYEDTFIKYSRLGHMVYCLGYHPKYLKVFIQTLDFVMNGDGPLKHDIRNYLAILVQLQENEFLNKGGERSWLKGVEHLPKRISNLLPLNTLLCHQPWYVSESHFKDLLVGNDSWSVAELVHAVVILSFYHSLAGFCLGCGINPEVDSEFGGHPTLRQCSNPALGLVTVNNTGSDTDSETLSPVECSPPNNDPSFYMLERYTGVEAGICTDRLMKDILREKLAEVSQEEEVDEEEQVKDRHFAESVSSFGVDTRRETVPPVPIPISLQKYIVDANYKHEDFTMSSVCTLRAREYSWEDHGFPFLNSLNPQMSELLDEKFKIAFELTYRKLGQEIDINTAPFRQAVWYYIQSIKGIRHDDYNYGNVNKILDKEFKTYIRMVACFPERVTKFDFNDSMTGLEYSEKVHVNVLALEARLQAELIYALKALMSYMK